MSQFEENEVLAKFDRSFGDKREELRLERGNFNGKPTFTLRLYWQAEDDTWRWASQKPTQSGKCWERINLKARELRDLGAALMAAADATSEPSARASRPRVKDTPQRHAERAKFDRQGTIPVASDDDPLPF